MTRLSLIDCIGLGKIDRSLKAASFNWTQDTGAPSSGHGTTVSELAASGNVANFQSLDVATPNTFSTNTIVASDATNLGNSYELWMRGHYQGSFNTVGNLKFWMSVPIKNSDGSTTGLTMKYACTATYAAPTANDSSISTGVTNTTTIPTSVPGSANIGIANSLSGVLTGPGYTDYIVLQLHMATTIPVAGDTTLATFTLQRDET